MRGTQKGLSLMEIMIALVIVAIIGGMAYPRYQKMIARSRQTEAKTILQAVFMGQDLYQTTNQVFSGKLEDLDVQIPSNAKYTYSVSVNENGSTFLAKAVSNIDSDAAIDEWQIDENNQLKNVINDVIE